jgi:hypothetical protein
MNTTMQYRDYLASKLLAQRSAMETANAYYTGSQALAFIDPEILRVMKGRIRALNVNFSRLVVDTLSQRLTVTGFASSPGDISDQQLWDLWQANAMDEQSQLAHTDALIYGRSFFLAWVGANGEPLITAESPLQVTVRRDPRTGALTAGLKRWLDDEGFTRSLLFTTETVTEYQSAQQTYIDPRFTQSPFDLVSDDHKIVSESPNPLGVVPIVALVNRPRLQFPDGESELTDVMPLVDGIAKLSSDLMIAAEYSASPRRWVTGLFPDTKATGTQADDMAERVRELWEKAHASKFLIAPDARTEFGQFDTASLTNYETAITMMTAQIAAIASLPPSYLSLLNSNPTSADAIRSSEARLTAKAEQRQRQWSGPYEDLMRLAVLIRDGQPDANLSDLQTLWQSAEPSTIAQTADAEAKLYAAGLIDRRAALIKLGYTPQEIERITQTPTTQGAIA